MALAWIACCFLPALTPSSALAQGRSLEIRSFHGDFVVQSDGTVRVTETIRVRFIGSWNGIVRHIPVEYPTDYGANYTLRLSVDAVEDDAGNDLRYEPERSGRNRVFRIFVPGANEATRTVVIRYSVVNALRFFEEHDELYWSVTGDESEFPILEASARVTLPAGVDGVRTAAFTGPRGSVESDVVVSQAGSLITFASDGSLRFREGLTIVVGWNPGLVGRPSLFDRIGLFLLSNLLLAIPLVAAGAMALVWHRHGRDPPLRSLAPEYEPPDGLTPAEAGTLLDTSPDLRDVTATIVDLAVRGFLVIDETETTALFGLLSGEVFTFTTAAERERWDELRAHERKLMYALFEDGDEVSTADLENSFYKKLPAIKSKLSDALVRDGHYLRHPNHVRTAFLIAGVLAGLIVAVPGSFLLEGALGQDGAVAVAAGIATALIIAAIGLFMPARTPRGTRMLERLRGFEEFLRRVESDRFDRMIKTPALFEEYLPYTMAFGVEKNWASAFDDIYRSPPDWYRGNHPGSFRAHSFTRSLGRMSSATGAAMTTAPRSSSGSSGFGGGGGGFSGGGFGGGGVGGF